MIYKSIFLNFWYGIYMDFCCCFCSRMSNCQISFSKKYDTTSWRLWSSLHKILLCFTFYFFDLVDVDKYTWQFNPKFIYLLYLFVFSRINFPNSFYIRFNEGILSQKFCSRYRFFKNWSNFDSFFRSYHTKCNFFIATYNWHNTWCSVCTFFILCKESWQHTRYS